MAYALGYSNPATRAEVTGGRHLDDLQALLVRVFVDAGIPAQLMDVKKRPIPGYFRRDKSWDVVVMIADRVVGIIELKSMVGDLPGQNYNNRTDEALGQAIDVWTAVERNIIDTPLRPWGRTMTSTLSQPTPGLVLWRARMAGGPGIAWVARRAQCG